MAVKDAAQGRCELVIRPPHYACNRLAVLRYPAMGGGYMRLCAEHGEKHAHYCEEWMGAGWSKAPVWTNSK